MSLLVTHRTASLAGGLSLPYLDQGPTGSRPVLLLHGITDSCRSFASVLACLPPSIRALAPSQRGHGGASIPPSFRLEDFAGDLAAFMDALSVERAVIVGHSMGAAIAQCFAIDHPERTLGLILVGAFAALGRNPSCVAFGETTMAPLSDPLDPAFVREFQQSTLARPIPKAVLDGIVSESLKVPARVWKAAWSTLLASDLTPDLHFITAPTLLVWGNRDELALQTEQEILLRSIPNARLETFAGAGHAPHWEEPERFAVLVADFYYRVAEVLR